MDGSTFLLEPRPQPFAWTSREDGRLRTLWADDISGRRIAALMGRSYKSVRIRAVRLGLPKKTRDEMRWTPQLVERLRAEIAAKKSARLIARDMGLKFSSVASKASELGLHFSGVIKLPRKPSTANPAAHRRNIEEAKERAKALKGQRCVYDPTNPLHEPKGCLWTIGDMHTPSWRFCQEAVMTHHPDGREARHQSWCAAHRTEVFWSPTAEAENLSQEISGIVPMPRVGV